MRKRLRLPRRHNGDALACVLLSVVSKQPCVPEMATWPARDASQLQSAFDGELLLLIVRLLRASPLAETAATLERVRAGVGEALTRFDASPLPTAGGVGAQPPAAADGAVRPV